MKRFLISFGAGGFFSALFFGYMSYSVGDNYIPVSIGGIFCFVMLIVGLFLKD